jgi:hypothetical protein
MNTPTKEEMIVSRISRLQVALHHVMGAKTIEEAKGWSARFLKEDVVAYQRQCEGNFNHPCSDNYKGD